MTNAETLAREARRFLDEGDSSYEKAAERMWRLRTEHGWTFQQIADAVSRPRGTVATYVEAYRRHDDEPAETFSPFLPEKRAAMDAASARKVLREAPPEQIAEMLDEPAIRAKVSRAQEIAHEKVEQKSRETFRENVGGEVADDLTHEKKLQAAEAELFAARRAVIGTLRSLHAIGSDMPDAWREEFLRTVDDVAQKLDMLRGLLAGVTDDDLDRLLAKED